jgi:hypothetical protein
LKPAGENTVSAVISYYIPRISVVVFIEVFAFFFLRLYKIGLDDVKYYQNELTNVELKLRALSEALKSGEAPTITLVITELAKTERNFVLKKGESTVGLENAKLEGRLFSEAIAKLTQPIRER